MGTDAFASAAREATSPRQPEFELQGQFGVRSGCEEAAMTTGERTSVSSGDVVEVVGRRVGDRRRTGEILEVLGAPDRPHYLVRWEDGHESIFYPAAGTHVRRRALPSALPAPELDLAAASAALVALLRDVAVEFELLPHRRTTTAANEARALGVLPQTVAKTLIAMTLAGDYVRAIVPAPSRLDLTKLARVVGTETITLLTEPELASTYPEFEVGAVPPFGGRVGDLVVVDQRIAECDHLVLDAGVHDTSLRLRTDDLVRLADAEFADIVEA
jgi:Ala-tRNA(Pro) deacylase